VKRPFARILLDQRTRRKKKKKKREGKKRFASYFFLFFLVSSGYNTEGGEKGGEKKGYDLFAHDLFFRSRRVLEAAPCLQKGGKGKEEGGGGEKGVGFITNLYSPGH